MLFTINAVIIVRSYSVFGQGFLHVLNTSSCSVKSVALVRTGGVDITAFAGVITGKTVIT